VIVAATAVSRVAATIMPGAGGSPAGLRCLFRGYCGGAACSVSVLVT
jgi:hypothetical protein